ncbi:MAG: hypothetical protein JO254_04455 [Pseudolabrys sp.]|nr:hypothetical protein [Pseudolabrys sp.]
MTDQSLIDRIYGKPHNDTQVVERAREASQRAIQVLKENPPPDMFIGRKTFEPFPSADE